MKKQLGFTLIELILYLALVTIMLSAIIPFAWNVIGSGAKSGTQEEVNTQARFISERLNMEIRNASGINSSDFDTNLALDPNKKLSLSETNGNNPTIIDVVSGQVQITQGSNPPVALNSTDTRVSNLTFSNFSSADNKTKNIEFTLTVQTLPSSARQEYQFSVSVESDAEVRSN